MFAPSWGVALKKEHTHFLFSMSVPTERERDKDKAQVAKCSHSGNLGKEYTGFFVQFLQLLWKSAIILK